MTKTMAEVLAEHSDYLWRTATGWECVCGHVISFTAAGALVSFTNHQAAALSAAGFGLVADAKREAWDEGYRLGVDDERTSQANPGIAGCFCHGWPCRCFIAPARNNPYRTEASS